MGNATDDVFCVQGGTRSSYNYRVVMVVGDAELVRLFTLFFFSAWAIDSTD
jgi:hypothetical protein